MRSRVIRVALLATCAVVVVGALAPVSSAARRIARKSDTALLPSVYPSGKLRKRERVVTISAHAAPDAEIEIVLQAYCIDAQIRVHRRERTFTGIGAVRGRIRKPPGRYRDCSASASVRVTNRPLAPSGGLPGPTRLAAALYARRR